LDAGQISNRCARPSGGSPAAILKTTRLATTARAGDAAEPGDLQPAFAALSPNLILEDFIDFALEISLVRARRDGALCCLHTWRTATRSYPRLDAGSARIAPSSTCRRRRSRDGADA